MSRIGKRPVELPNGVSLSVSGRELSVKGPLGSLTQVLPEGVEVKVDGQPITLTSMEFELLALLARRSGKKVSRDEILNELRGIDAAIMTRSVDIMISRLRNKLGDSLKPPRFIQTVWGTGYAFVPRQTQDD